SAPLASNCSALCRSVICCRSRAISFFNCGNSRLFFTSPRSLRSRSMKRSLRFSSSSFCAEAISSARISRTRSLRFDTLGLLSHNELGLDWQLVRGQAHRLFDDLLTHAAQLEEHTPRLDDRDPMVGRALAGTHARLRRLRRDRLVGEDTNPDLATALDVTG